MAKETLIEWKDEENGRIVKITKDKKGRRWLEVDLLGNMKSKLESLVEDSPLKGAFKWAMRYVPKDFHLDDIIKTEIATNPDGLRIEESNGDFYLIEMPKEEAEKFIDVIDSSTDLMAGID
ncbi:MAG: hypothetical protein ACTSVI_11090 [Promethearchaeota archaeon]